MPPSTLETEGVTRVRRRELDGNVFSHSTTQHAYLRMTCSAAINEVQNSVHKKYLHLVLAVLLDGLLLVEPGQTAVVPFV